jgi:alpha-mannosidase
MRRIRWSGTIFLSALVLLPGRFVPLFAQSVDRAKVLQRLEEATVLPLSPWRFKEGFVLRGEAVDLDDSTWTPFPVGEEWSTGPAWFRYRVTVPPTVGGYDIGGARLRLRVRIVGENPVHLTVFFNGEKRAEGNDLDPIVLTESARPGDEFVIAVKADVPGGRTWMRAGQLEVEAPPSRPDPRTFLQEYQVAEALLNARPGDRSRWERYLDDALRKLDLAALDRGDQQAFDRSLREAREALAPIAPLLREFAIRAVGNSHIDLAWLWPWTETVEIVRDTFSTVLHLMHEFPEFTFAHGAAQTYAWMEEKYPKLFEQIRQRVREGRWEIVGGVWVESDMNLPHGESLVRQFLHGMRYFKEKFGVEVRVGWNPDAFGYNWQLPQILKKSGLEFFVTQKLFWNEVTRFPYRLFWWEAPDGSRVLTYFPNHYGNPIEPVPMAKDLADYAAATGHREYMHLYGVGDHGGGPTRSMLETATRWRAAGALYPRLFFGTVHEFFERAMAELPRLNPPVWRDELYLETHRGTYTSQAATKRNNRQSEILLLNAEKFSALAQLFGHPYPQGDLDAAWKKVLFNQFHDILPGSSIAAVYRDAERDYAEVRRIGREALQGALRELADRIRTKGPGLPLIVFNPLSWTRTDVVEAVLTFPDPVSEVEVRDPRGRRLIAEILERDPQTNRVKIRFIAEDVPPLGYAVFRVVPVARRPSLRSSLSVSGLTMENEFLRVTVDARSGCLTSLYDKVARREVLDPSQCGNLLQTFYDKPSVYDAWNIDANFEEKMWELRRAEDVRVLESGPTRAVIRVVKKFQQSTFIQDLILYPKIPRLECRMDVEWREKHILLKVAFPVSVRSPKATFEIPFGAIPRPTTRRTPEERAKFEVPALFWADLSDGDYGVSVLNDSKYGYDVRDNVIRLTLLRSPAYPDPHADEGRHHLTYAVYPHAGDWVRGGTVRRGYELNYPLIPYPTTEHSGSLPPVHSFLDVEPDTVVLTAVKKAEDGDAWILRFYEFAGKATDVKIRLPRPPKAVVEVNLVEREIGPVTAHEREVIVPTKPYEIKTVRIEFRPEEERARR